MPAKIDMTGKKFHRLIVIREAGRDNSGQVLWECRCDCGNTSIVRGRDLRSGGTKVVWIWRRQLIVSRKKQ